MPASESRYLMNESQPVAAPVERRTIEHVPVDERHGRARDLFTIWFGSNIMLLTIITGALATTVFGLPLWAGALSIILGNVVGAVVMALHAAQGPQMGVPQMLQTRAQFGSYGSLLVVVLVVFMYLGFFASNAVLGGQALAKVTGLPTNWGIVLVGLISLSATIAGYHLIHRVTALLSIVAGGALLVAFVWMVGVNGVPAQTWHTSGFTWAGFMATLSVAALWQIAYAPYVSDYTRYMPKDTGQRATASSASKLLSTSWAICTRSSGSSCRSMRPVARRETSSSRSSVSSRRCSRCSIRRSCDCTHATVGASPDDAICSVLSSANRN